LGCSTIWGLSIAVDTDWVGRDTVTFDRPYFACAIMRSH